MAARRAAELARYLPSDTGAPYLDDLLADYPSRGGKMLRPAICIAAALAFGGEPEARRAARRRSRSCTTDC